MKAVAAKARKATKGQDKVKKEEKDEKDEFDDMADDKSMNKLVYIKKKSTVCINRTKIKKKKDLSTASPKVVIS